MTALCFKCGKPMQAAEAIAHTACPGGSEIEGRLDMVAAHARMNMSNLERVKFVVATCKEAVDELAALRERLRAAEEVVEAARRLAAICNAAAFVYSSPSLKNANDDVLSALSAFDAEGKK